MTYLLIHGGGSSARFWDRLLPFLDQPALAIDLPGRNGRPADLGTLTVDEEVASVLADVGAADLADPIVVVAHSSGGLVVPGVLAGLGGRVSHVVMNAASVPPEGGCGLDCMQERHADGVKLAREVAQADGTVITTPGRLPTPRRSARPTAATSSTTRRSRTWSTPSVASPTRSTTTSSRCTGRPRRRSR